MRHMEECLDLPLKEVLQIMQDRLMSQSTYFGVQTLKSPTDFWVYQEILFTQQPDVIVEIGNFCGGNLLALAHLCDALGRGRVIGIDVSHANVPEVVRSHPRITLIEGDACAMFPQVKAQLTASDRVLVIEDSSHTFENTLNILTTYAELIPVEGYFIVEDSICYHGLEVGPQPGPYEAIEAFAANHPQFVIDRSQESFLITWNPKGYLKRVQ